MKASLASSISLLALVLLLGHQARATPSVGTGAPDDAICGCAQSLSVAAPNYASISAHPYAPTGEKTFSPMSADGSAPDAATSPFETISTINRTVVFDHVKPGKLAAGAGWSNAVGSSVYVGTYASSIVGSGEINTPQPGTQSRVDFGTIALNSSHTLALEIQNLATDPGSASDLTIEGFRITGADPGSFSVGSDIADTVISAGGTLLVPLTVVGTGPGYLTSNLTIFASALGGGGETFNYLLDPMVVTGHGETLPTPEPASIALVGAGLLALAGVRRRRAAARL